MRTQTCFALAPLALIALVAAPCIAQVDAAAKKTLEESAEAVKNLGSGTFTVKMTTEGLGTFVYEAEMKVKLIRDPKATAASHTHSYQLIGDFKSPGGKEGDSKVHAAMIEGKMGEWIDVPSKTLFIRPLKGGPKSDVLSKVQTPNKAFETVLLEPNPFKAEIDAPKITMERSENVGGEECMVIKAVLSGGAASRYVWVSALDKLPRKYEQRMGKEEPGVTQQIRRYEIKDFNTETNLTVADIHLKAPEGYKTDKVDLPPPPAPSAVKPVEPVRGPDTDKQRELEIEKKKQTEKEAQRDKVPDSYEIDSPKVKPGKNN